MFYCVTPKQSQTIKSNQIISYKLIKIIPNNTKALIVLNFDNIPSKIKLLLLKMQLLKFPIKTKQQPSKIILLWENPRSLNKNNAFLLFEKAINTSIFPKTINYHNKQLYNLSTNYKAIKLHSQTVYIAKKNNVFMAIDIINHQTNSTFFKHSELIKILSTFSTSFAGITYAALSVNQKFSFGYLHPIKIGFNIRFPLNWIVLKCILTFKTTEEAEKSIKIMQKYAIRFAANPLLQKILWKEIFTPLSVHSEGKNVYIQWNTHLNTFYLILNNIKSFLKQQNAK